jgi:hypothetical protein
MGQVYEEKVAARTFCINLKAISVSNQGDGMSPPRSAAGAAIHCQRGSGAAMPVTSSW